MATNISNLDIGLLVGLFGGIGSFFRASTPTASIASFRARQGCPSAALPLDDRRKAAYRSRRPQKIDFRLSPYNFLAGSFGRYTELHSTLGVCHLEPKKSNK